MADAHAKNHDYHLVDPSPWPFVGSVSAFILAVGAVFWMHGDIGPWVMLLGSGRRALHHVHVVARRDHGRRIAAITRRSFSCICATAC